MMPALVMSWVFVLFFQTDRTVSQWVIGDNPLPRADDQMAVGAYNGKIFIIGGYDWRKSLVEYDTATQLVTDHGRNAITGAETYGWAQYWSQQGSILYMIQAGAFNIYDMSATQFTSNWAGITLPIDVGDDGCLASDASFLYILGGDPDGIDALQILRLTSLSWMSNPPPMQQRRQHHSCVVHNGYLWAFGGQWTPNKNDNTELATNERIHTADIAQNAWNYIQPLTHTIENHGAVAFGDFIYVTGGQDGDSVNFDFVHVVNANTGDVVLSPHRMLNINEWGAPIVVDSILYVFGGFDDGSGLSTQWQYYPLDTTTGAPIAAPTQHPSSMPSPNPTDAPVVTVTSMDPTVIPSIHPSDIPATYPTLQPSYNPTASPTEYPTLQPSIHPTTTPSDAPASLTQYPTLQPSIHPTTTPSDAPTLQPSINPTTTRTPSEVPTGYPSTIPTTAVYIVPTPRVPTITTQSPTRPPASNYTVFIGLNCDEEDGSECSVDTEALKQHILVAIAGDVEIFRSEIINDEVVITLSITTVSGQVLETDDIKRDIEREIEGNADFSDVDVEQQESDSEDSDDDAQMQWIGIPMPSGLMVQIAVVACAFLLCCVPCFICLICWNKRKQRNRGKNAVELEKYQGSATTTGTTNTGELPPTENAQQSTITTQDKKDVSGMIKRQDSELMYGPHAGGGTTGGTISTLGSGEAEDKNKNSADAQDTADCDQGKNDNSDSETDSEGMYDNYQNNNATAGGPDVEEMYDNYTTKY